ncbi:MAG TPA: hypothetical protein VHL80_14000 [Polyangia bacterium]|nr:hypothetical protein [Polyangia bacterium]
MAGLATSDELAAGQSERLRQSLDLGVQALRLAAAQLGEDLRQERREGPRALGKAGRRAVAPWILFLRSDLEYQWPDLTVWRTFVLALPDLLKAGAEGDVRSWRGGHGGASSSGRR